MPRAKFVSFKLAHFMSKHSQYGTFSEQLKVLGFGFMTDYNFDAQDGKRDLPWVAGKSHFPS